MVSKEAVRAQTVDASPEEVVRRLEGGVLMVRDLWIVSPRDRRAWDRSTDTLYARRLGPGRWEVGPRLASLAAARWCPVVTVVVHPEGAGTLVRLGRLRTSRTAAVVLGGVSALVVAWAVLLWVAWRAGSDEARAWPFCAGLAGALAFMQAVAWGPGAQAIKRALPDLWRIVERPAAGQDDW